MNNAIYPCLWFDNNGREAAELYAAAFNDVNVTSDTPIVVVFEIGGQKFMALNGGPMFKMNASISLFVVCETVEETERAWTKLIEGGSVLMPMDKYPWSEKYGWLQDRFGATWQISLGRLCDVGQKATPTLMFVKDNHGKAREAIGFYTSLFKNSSVTGILPYDGKDGGVEGTVKHAQFVINGYTMMAMDNAHSNEFQFNEGISLVVECEDQEEIDRFWNSFAEGGKESRCGWVQDKYGVWWQVVPKELGTLMNDPLRGQNVAQALMKMKKLNLRELRDA